MPNGNKKIDSSLEPSKSCSNANTIRLCPFAAQVSYKIETLKTILKVGGNHIGIDNNDYRSRPGGPFVGKLFYVSLTFDEFLN